MLRSSMAPASETGWQPERERERESEAQRRGAGWREAASPRPGHSGSPKLVPCSSLPPSPSRVLPASGSLIKQKGSGKTNAGAQQRRIPFRGNSPGGKSSRVATIEGVRTGAQRKTVQGTQTGRAEPGVEALARAHTSARVRPRMAGEWGGKRAGPCPRGAPPPPHRTSLCPHSICSRRGLGVCARTPP